MTEDELADGGPLSHLSRGVRAVALKDDTFRIAEIVKERFLPYTRATKILEDLEALYRRPTAVRAQGRLFIGPSLAGKSSIFAKFAENHRADDNVDGEAAIVPVLCVQYPEKASEGIYPSICHALNHRPPASASPSRIRGDCLELLKAVDVRILLIDEFHNVLLGNRDEQRIGIATIKTVMNDLGRPLVVAGTAEAYNAINKEAQMLSRLRPIYLHRLQETDEDYIELLVGFEMSLPLRQPSNLAAPEMASEIYRLTDGLVGHISDLLSELAIRAIEEGDERITLEALMENGWAPMADKQQVEQAV